MDTLSLTKEARIYNGLKTISLTSDAGKSGHLPTGPGSFLPACSPGTRAQSKQSPHPHPRLPKAPLQRPSGDRPAGTDTLTLQPAVWILLVLFAGPVPGRPPAAPPTAPQVRALCLASRVAGRLWAEPRQRRRGDGRPPSAEPAAEPARGECSEPRGAPPTTQPPPRRSSPAGAKTKH